MTETFSIPETIGVAEHTTDDMTNAIIQIRNTTTNSKEFGIKSHEYAVKYNKDLAFLAGIICQKILDPDYALLEKDR